MTIEAMDHETEESKPNQILFAKNQHKNKLHPPTPLAEICFDAQVQTWHYLQNKTHPTTTENK